MATVAAVVHGFGKVRLGMDEGYEGELIGGVPWGQGQASFSDGSTYVGGWKDGSFDGVGRLHASAPASQKPASRPSAGTSLYRGEFRGGDEEGLGVLVEQGATYKGQFSSGFKGGCGVETRMGGREMYLGQFRGGRRHGLALSRRGRGCLIVERWEDGKRVQEGAEVAKDFVGGIAEATAKVAEAAFVALGMLADRKAQDAPDALPAFVQRSSKSALPGPTVAQIAGEAVDRRLSKAESQLSSLKKRIAENAVEAEELAAAARKAEKLADERKARNVELSKESEKLKQDLAACRESLRHADIRVEAVIESQQELVTELLHKQAEHHRQRLEVTVAQHAHTVASLHSQLDVARHALEAHEGGDNQGSSSSGAKGGDPPKVKKVMMRALTMEGQSREEGKLALSEDGLTLCGPRGYAAVGKPVKTSSLAYTFKVERLGKEVEGYLGVFCEDTPSLTAGFAMRFDDGTLGSGRFRSCEEVEGSRRVDDGCQVVLQVDADQDCLRLFQGTLQVASVAVPFPKPWQPALLLMHEGSVVKLEGELRDAGKLSVDGVIEERVGPDWSARSVRTGSVFGVVQVLRLLQSVVLGSFEMGELEDMLASYQYGRERVMQCIQSRLNGTVSQIEGGDW